MPCTLCRLGDAHPGITTVTLVRGETAVIVKGVPAAICENCGEYYLSEDVAGNVLDAAIVAVQSGAEVEILHYSAA